MLTVKASNQPVKKKETKTDMHVTKRVWVSLLVLPWLVAGCNQVSTSSKPTSLPSVPPASEAPAKPVVTGLPDFTRLVKKEGPAVVNISTTVVHAAAEAPQVPSAAPDGNGDPLFDFFRQFMGQGGAMPQPAPAQSLGSGFIISKDGYILTNFHVVEGGTDIRVKLTDKREFKAKVIGADKLTDLALLKIDAHDLPVVDIGNSDQLQVGEWVAAIGSPFGFDNSVTAGIISAKGRSLPSENYVPFLQTDAAINPGNSGGPLFNLQGQVVGINSQIYSQTGGYMGIGFAIPINVALDVAKQLQAHGKVSRGRLGVAIQDVTADLAKSFGIPSAHGALIASVEKGGPADRAGIQAGDVVLKYNNQPVDSATALPRMVAETRPGTTVTLEIWRKGSMLRKTVQVGELSSAKGPAKPAQPGQSTQPQALHPKHGLGLSLQDLSQDQRDALGIQGGLRVNQATGVVARAGIHRGDILLAVNNVEIQSFNQLEQALAPYKPGQTIALLVLRNGNALYIPITLGKG